MSDAMRERYPASQELYEPTAEAQELLEDRKRQAEAPSAREKFFESRPELEALTREPVTSSNKAQVFDAVKSARLENLKAEFANRENDLTESERSFAGEVLTLRLSRCGSVKGLLDDLHIDCGNDFNRAVIEAKEIRGLRVKHDSLKARYQTMADFTISPESYVVRPL